MTEGVRVLVALPGATRDLTAALTLSRLSPGGSRVGQEGSSSTLGFLALGGRLSCGVVGEEMATDGVWEFSGREGRESEEVMMVI